MKIDSIECVYGDLGALSEALDKLNDSLIKFHESFQEEKMKLFKECEEHRKFFEEQENAELE